ncbi:AhpC/TSA family protein [bacterium A37T11]|nr:AhpC/TSA family protein [bacterium A37T11]
MKQILRLGESNGLSPIKRHVLYTLLISLYIILLPTGFAQAQSASVKDLGIPEGGLKIGDTIPEALWHLPLQVVNHPEGKDTITLNDYRGKLIILDFWERSCVPCVRALPALNKLQQANHKNVSILLSTQDKADVTEKLFEKNTYLKNLQLSSFANNPLLLKVFPHKVVSHIVWIKPSGKIFSTTYSDQITQANINAILTAKINGLPPKLDVMAASTNEIHVGMPADGVKPPEHIYFSILTSGIPGISWPQGLRSTPGNKLFRRYNLTLLDICYLAQGTSSSEGVVPHFKLAVKDSSRFYKSRNQIYSAWKEEHMYCYIVQLPPDIPDKQRREFIKADLLRWLSVLGVSIKRDSDNQYTITETH